MLIALTGTPGTGKTSISNSLYKNGFNVVHLTEIIKDSNFQIGFDKKRNSNIIDTLKLNKYINEKYKNENVVFIEGHLSHLLSCIEKIIILRCHPTELRKRLSKKGWNNKKINENVEAEILDIILCETLEIQSKNNIFEIDTTNRDIENVALIIIEIIRKNIKILKKHNIGKIDWSEEIFQYFK
jgi:adenylate kinase